MIKIWPESLDANYPGPTNMYGPGSQSFVKDLVMFSPLEFVKADSIETCDVIVISQFSNYVLAPYVFDKAKADYITKLKKPIILENTGGGVPDTWRKTELGDYIWGDFADLIKVMFSTECYSWHRNELPKGINYVSFDYVGFVDFGLGLREIYPLQSREDFLKRPMDTFISMNMYPPTRDRLWDILTESPPWKAFNHRTHLAHEDPSLFPRLGWRETSDGMFSAKIGFAPDGATGKTERHLTTPSFTVMMKQEDDMLEFAYPWIDGVNCLEMVHDFFEGYSSADHKNQNGHNIRVLNKEKTKAKIIEWLDRPEDLYDIYTQGYLNEAKYRLPNYFKNHVGKTIIKSI